MTEAVHNTIYRKDYSPFDYLINSTDLRFELGEETTIVTSRLELQANYDARQASRALVLNGHRFRLLGLTIDGARMEPERYTVTPEQLIIHTVQAAFTLEIRTALRPQDNTFLEGLYRSEGMFCTQCEAEGFRSITYYPDRPDVLSVFTTTII
ncbi:MAG: aminopeptidase N, partial [Steroidobacteraceae bacterium]|nr:aminopeptidase N [Deltaproteobacteria bacterium]